MTDQIPDVFLSYSREDQVIARRFAEGMQRQGFTVWWDVTLQPGEVYDKVTELALEQARAVVVLWSRTSVQSRWVRSEATTGDRNGTLLPVMIEACKRPIQFELMHTVDLSHWKGDAQDAVWQLLMASISRLTGAKALSHTATALAVTPRSVVPKWVAITSAAAVLLVLAAGVVWWRPWEPRPVVAAAAAAPSIAVLPFVNLSDDKQQEYFSDGLAEELLNQLAQVPDLKVIGRSSSFAFKGRTENLRRIGQLLGVNHVLEGSVRKAGDRIKVTAELISAVDETLLWSQTYERKLIDVFAIQDEIARKVVGQLRLKMGVQGREGGTTNVAAYDEFLAGKALLNSNSGDSMHAAVPHLERAVTLDPEFLTARLWLIDAYLRLSLGDYRSRQAVIKKEDAAIDEVVRRVPNTPEASFALSYRAARGTDLVELERLLLDAMRVPGSAGARAKLRYGQFLLSVGRAGAALQVFEEVRQADPLDDFDRTQELLALAVAGATERFAREAASFIQTPGGNEPTIHNTVIGEALGRHDATRAREAAQAAFASGKLNAQQREQVLLKLDDPATALLQLQREARDSHLRGDVYLPGHIARDAAFLGDRKLAFEAERALISQDLSFETVTWVIWEPVMRELFADPQFKAIMRDAGVVDYWRATGRWSDFCKPVGVDDFECH